MITFQKLLCTPFSAWPRNTRKQQQLMKVSRSGNFQKPQGTCAFSCWNFIVNWTPSNIYEEWCLWQLPKALDSIPIVSDCSSVGGWIFGQDCDQLRLDYSEIHLRKYKSHTRIPENLSNYAFGTDVCTMQSLPQFGEPPILLPQKRNSPSIFIGTTILLRDLFLS